MPKNLHKIQKQVSKKRGGKPTTLHENSRDVKRLQQGGQREEKLARALAERARAHGPYLERVAFLQELLARRESLVSDVDIAECVKLFTTRNSEELNFLQQSRRPGRPAHPRESQLLKVAEIEKKEMVAGFWIPEVRDEKSREKLQRWDGMWSSLSALQFVRWHEGDGLIVASRWPPTGLS